MVQTENLNPGATINTNVACCSATNEVNHKYYKIVFDSCLCALSCVLSADSF